MEAAGIEGARSAADAMYRELGLSAVEFVWMAVAGRKALERVKIEGSSVEVWRAAVARGRGVVVAASHTGNWDLAACAIAQEIPLTVVTKHLRVTWLDRIWQGARAAQGVRLVDAEGALKSARETLRRGGAVAMMIDQVPTSAGHAILVDFLGVPALADRAPAALAAASGAPLVVATSRRLEDGSHRLHVLRVLWPPPRPGRAWVEEATRASAHALGAFVRRYPSQWLWLHRRWKQLDHLPAGAMLPAPCKTRSSSPGAPFGAA